MSGGCDLTTQLGFATRVPAQHNRGHPGYSTAPGHTNLPIHAGTEPHVCRGSLAPGGTHARCSRASLPRCSHRAVRAIHPRQSLCIAARPLRSTTPLPFLAARAHQQQNGDQIANVCCLTAQFLGKRGGFSSHVHVSAAKSRRMAASVAKEHARKPLKFLVFFCQLPSKN